MTHCLWRSICLSLLASLLFAGAAEAQQRLGYVDTQRIMAEFKEYQEIKKRQDEIFQEFEKALRDLEGQEAKLQKELEEQSLVLSDQRRMELQKQLATIGQQRTAFIKEKFGTGGELEKQSAELAQPLMERIAAIIQRIGAEEDFDYIFDLQNMGIVYVRDPQLDVTDRVLEELNRGL
jgi:outer membrane protein